MRKGYSKRLASIAVLIEGPASAVLLAKQFESIVAGGILDPISRTSPQPLGLGLSADSGVRLVATGSKVGAFAARDPCRAQRGSCSSDAD